MRNLVLRIAAIAGVVFTLGACGDNPTHPEQQQRAPDVVVPALDAQAPMGCVIEGMCVLPPLIVDGGCDPWESLDWCDPGDCMTSVPWNPDSQGTMGCPGGGGAPGGGGGAPPPPTGPDAICPTADTGSCLPGEAEGEEEYSDICPQPIQGKVATALVPIAGRNHEFKFEGPFWRVNPLVGRSPAWYRIARPKLSKDDSWMAESGYIQLVCWGRYQIILGTRTWVGTMYVQSTDLHVVMGPGHPDF